MQIGLGRLFAGISGENDITANMREKNYANKRETLGEDWR